MSDREFLEWTDEKVTDFWNYWSQWPERYFTYQFGDVITGRLKKYLAGRSLILDYGCGTGFLMTHLLSLGSQVMGVDFSPKSVKATNERLKGRENFEGAWGPDEIKMHQKKFDAVVTVEVIEHLNDSYLGETLSTIRDLLNDQGVAIFTTPNDENLEESFVYCPESKKVFHRWQHVRSWSEQSLRTHLETSGFSVIEGFTTDFSVSASRNKVGAIKFLAKKALGRKLPHLVLIAQKKI